MYDFVYWFFYKYFAWRKGFQSSFVASSVVWLAISLHILLLYSLVKLFTGWSLDPILTKHEYGERKWIMIACMLPLVFLLDFFYFRIRKTYILEKFKSKKPFTVKNITLILLLLFVPAVLSFVLS